ncbi:GNAT family N-acetyltransferase [Wolbachia endosymbiont (group B) of Limnophora tigrina]|uniref:GNAT family N-acetyltransferase n=1 Tax=Wolbachia endosymbiont (group B) of Limnophora tigrina TaxID=3139317 RepID=UPI0035B5206C
MVEIEQISPDIAEDLCCKITADLSEYFGLPECNEHYAVGVRSCKNLAAKIDGNYIGLLSLDFPYPNNSNIHWMDVFRNYQRQGVGYKLVEAACSLVNTARTMTVETLSPNASDENYLKTYKFYESCGFEPLFNLKPQGYKWNMVYIMKNLNQIHQNRPEKYS